MKKLLISLLVITLFVLAYQGKRPFFVLSPSAGLVSIGIINKQNNNIFINIFDQQQLDKVEKMKQTILKFFNTHSNPIDRKAFQETIENRPELLMGYIMGMQSAIISYKTSSEKEKAEIEQLSYYISQNFVPEIAKMMLSPKMYKQMISFMRTK